MKKTLIIILAVVLILVGGVWVYLMMFGAPESGDELFADLGFSGTNATNEFERPVEQEQPFVSNETAIDDTQALNLLTLGPVAGAVIVGTTTDMQSVRYVNRTNGFIAEIDLTNNSETNLLTTSRGPVKDAVWSPDGAYVVINSGTTVDEQTELLVWKEGNASSAPGFSVRSLPTDAYNFGFNEDSTELYYLRTDAEGSLAYVYDLATLESRVWFSLPFIAPAVAWNDTPLIYNRPGEGYTGYAYRYVNNQLQTVGFGSTELVATLMDDQFELLTSKLPDGQLVSYLGDTVDLYTVEFIALPEKCDSHLNEGSATVYCGAPQSTTNGLPTSWYKGQTTLVDDIWSFTIGVGNGNKLADLQALSGQAIDVIDMSVDYTGTRLLFRDKTTNALWFYDTAVE